MVNRRPLTWETLGYLLLAFALVVAALVSSCHLVPATVGDIAQLRESSARRAAEQDQAVDQARADYQKRIAAAEAKHQARLAAVEEEAEDRAVRVLEMALLATVGATGTGGVILDRLRDRRRKKRGEKTETKEKT